MSCEALATTSHHVSWTILGTNHQKAERWILVGLGTEEGAPAPNSKQTKEPKKIEGKNLKISKSPLEFQKTSKTSKTSKISKKTLQNSKNHQNIQKPPKQFKKTLQKLKNPLKFQKTLKKFKKPSKHSKTVKQF
jgi:hypothetical protein